MQTITTNGVEYHICGLGGQLSSPKAIGSGAINHVKATGARLMCIL